MTKQKDEDNGMKDEYERILPESEDPVDAVELADASDTPIACENVTNEEMRRDGWKMMW